MTKPFVCRVTRCDEYSECKGEIWKICIKDYRVNKNEEKGKERFLSEKRKTY